jgi:hypothetical protein
VDLPKEPVASGVVVAQLVAIEMGKQLGVAGISQREGITDP